MGGEDEYLIAKDDQIVPEAGAHEERTVEELTEETFMNAFSEASLQGAIYLFMTAWDNRIYKDFRAANVSKEFQTDMRECIEACLCAINQTCTISGQKWSKKPTISG